MENALILLGLITLISENNRHLISGDNPLYLLLKLILIDWSDDSCIINQISSNIWDYENNMVGNSCMHSR